MVCTEGIFTISFNPSGAVIVITPPNGELVLFLSVSGIETLSSVATSTGILVVMAKGNWVKIFFSVLPIPPSAAIPSTIVRKDVISSEVKNSIVFLPLFPTSTLGFQ